MSRPSAELVQLYLKYETEIARLVRTPQDYMVGKNRLPLVLLRKLPEEVRGPLADYVGPEALYFSVMGMGISAPALMILGHRIRDAMPKAPPTPPPELTPDDEEEEDSLPELPAHPAQAPRALPAVSQRTTRRRPSVHTLVKVDQIHTVLAELNRAAKGSAAQKDRQEAQRVQLLEDLRDKPTRVLLMAHRRQLQALEELRMHFPNFGGVLDWLRKCLRLRMVVKGSMSFPPILLSGPPGVGKTEFSKRLSESLGAEFLSLSVAATTASFALRGSHKQWSHGGPGQIAQAVARLKEKRAQFVLLDEVDKLQEGNRNYPVEPVLLEVLEPGQSDRFTDEFLEVEMNITPIVSWIATANDTSKISAPLRSRLELFEVPLPTPEQMPAVIRSVDRALRAAQPGLAKAFAPLDELVIDQIKNVSPRDLRVVLEQAYGSALDRPKQGGRHRVSREDVKQSMARRATTTAPTEKRSEEPEQEWVMMVPVKRTGGSGPPPGNTVH